MIHTSLPNKIFIYCFIIILLGSDLAHFELHHVTSKCTGFVRKDVAYLAEFFINSAGVHFAALAVEHFILVILNHLDVNFDRASLVAQNRDLKVEVRVTVLDIPAPIRKTQQNAHHNNENDYPDNGLIRILIKSALLVPRFVLILHELGI